MPEIWLESNHRLLLPLAVPAGLVMLLGASAVAFGFASSPGWTAIGAVLILIAAAYFAMAYVYIRQPRLTADDDHLRVHIGFQRVIAVPLEFVEVFFMGHAASMVRGADGKEAETATVVIRLAERAKEWHNRDVPAHLMQWCDGYVIIRGTWCEPIDMPLLDRLNGKLAAAHRRRKEAAGAET